jgi:hypothetical protein
MVRSQTPHVRARQAGSPARHSTHGPASALPHCARAQPLADPVPQQLPLTSSELTHSPHARSLPNLGFSLSLSQTLATRTPRAASSPARARKRRLGGPGRGGGAGRRRGRGRRRRAPLARRQRGARRGVHPIFPLLEALLRAAGAGARHINSRPKHLFRQRLAPRPASLPPPRARAPAAGSSRPVWAPAPAACAPAPARPAAAARRARRCPT